VKAFYCDTFVLPLPPSHTFPMAKYARLREHLLRDAVLRPEELHVPRAARWDELALVHTPSYLSGIASGTISADAQRRIGFPWSPAMVERSRRSVGGSIEAAHAALAEGVAVNLAGGTHHAFADSGAGFCVFNDVAVSARVLLSEGRVSRVAVLDTDVHQGDGTAHIFRNAPEVFTCSLHGENNFPFRKQQSDLDITFEDGTRDAEYLLGLGKAIDAVAAHDPQIIFYVAGADPYEADRFGRLKLTVEGLAERDRLVFEAALSRGIPVSVCMAGGYAADVDAIARIHANTVREARRTWGLRNPIGTNFSFCHTPPPDTPSTRVAETEIRPDRN
jgi:acetoin utilization deacetylase AcuC-like enzyme